MNQSAARGCDQCCDPWELSVLPSAWPTRIEIRCELEELLGSFNDRYPIRHTKHLDLDETERRQQ